MATAYLTTDHLSSHGVEKKHVQDKTVQKVQHTSRNLPNTLLVNRKLILVHLDLNSAGLHVEDHVHVSRVLGALHLVGTEFDESPVEEGTAGADLGELEAAVSDIAGLNAFLGPGDGCCAVRNAVDKER